ncbi:BldC family transcriptional regulator [Nocardiopsis sp. YSL2]|uniref:BldC family transcriptional regulator n=1 Tax=Nocardiopsis sp. YSL2 TaxID=2939492 RepID=UPI0026F43B02|nr:BldC family transcriptional regulator [Nocardiopsis sp. YSL2]
MSTAPKTPVSVAVDVLTATEVAQAFRVDAKTVSRWANEGRISSFRTPGGHRRFHKHEVDALLAASTSLAH